MNASIEAGIRQIYDAAKSDGYSAAISDVRLAVQQIMSEEPDNSVVLWGVMGALSRLETESKFARKDAK